MRYRAILTLLFFFAALGLLLAAVAGHAQSDVRIRSYPVPAGAHPHDVAPDPAGGIVWYTAQHQGALGRLDPASAQNQQMLSDEALITALRGGGYNIYFRHAPTDWSQNDHVAAKGDWTSCDPARMRQLSAEGRTIAQRIGAAIRRLRFFYAFL